MKTVSFKQAIIATALALLGTLWILSAFGQVIRKDSTGNYTQVKAATVKPADENTGKTLTDMNGNVWPVYRTKSGKLYALRTSKSGKVYRQYLAL